MENTSLIIPIEEDRIELAKRAILSAKLNNFGEIIVVGSNLVEKGLSKVVNDIIFVEGKGNTASRYNKGINKSTCDFIMLLNDDDFYLKLPEIYRSDEDFIFSDYYLLQGGQIGRFVSKPTILKRVNYIGYMTVRIRSKILKKEKFDESLDFCEDYELWLRLQKKGLKMKYYPLAFAIYDNDSSLTHKSSNENAERRLKMIEDIKDRYDNSRKTLLIITTKDKPEYLEKALSSLQDKLDVMVINDGMDESGKIKDMCNNFKVGLITKPEAGLTDSWNKGFNYFMEKEYNNCILSNDDVKFSKGFSEGLIIGLEEYDIVAPLSNKPGHQQNQLVNRFTGINVKEDMETINRIEEDLSKYIKEPYMEFSYINGFCFAFSRGIEDYKFKNDLLFDPKNINIQNEDDLCRRVINNGGKIAMCKTSFVFHYKNVTLKR